MSLLLRYDPGGISCEASVGMLKIWREDDWSAASVGRLEAFLVLANLEVILSVLERIWFS